MKRLIDLRKYSFYVKFNCDKDLNKDNESIIQCFYNHSVKIDCKHVPLEIIQCVICIC